LYLLYLHDYGESFEAILRGNIGCIAAEHSATVIAVQGDGSWWLSDNTALLLQDVRKYFGEQ
jgi:hypothetical protein